MTNRTVLRPDGVSIAVTDLGGDGPVVVLLHGLLSWTFLVCQCIKYVSGVVGEFGLGCDLLSGEADGDVLEWA